MQTSILEAYKEIEIKLFSIFSHPLSFFASFVIKNWISILNHYIFSNLYYVKLI